MGEKKKKFKRTFIDEIEGERNDDVEFKQRTKDKKKIELRRQRNLVQVLEAESRLNDIKKTQHRPILKLVEPQITEEQLGVIAKYNEKKLIEQTITNQLINKTKKKSLIELRTPSTGKKINSQIQMAIQFRQAQTLVLPEKTLDLRLIRKSNSLNHKFVKERTPNILLDHLRNKDLAQNVFDISEENSNNRNKTPKCNLNSINTPIRKITKKQKKNKSKTLQKAFAHLPSAIKDYDISQINIFSEDENLTQITDQNDVVHGNNNLKKQTQVSKLNIEYPNKVTKIRIISDSNNQFLNGAAGLINEEMISALRCGKQALVSTRDLVKNHEKILNFTNSEKYLNKAKKILVEELKKVKKKQKFNQFCSFSIKSNTQCFYFPQQDQFDFLKNYSFKERLDAVRQNFSVLRKDLIIKMRKKYKLEKEMQCVLGDPIKNVELIKIHIKKYFNDYIKYENEIKVFKMLQKIERKAILKRSNQWQQLIKLANIHEKKIQSRYQYFVHELNHLNEIYNNA